MPWLPARTRTFRRSINLEPVVITDSPPADQIQKILDHGHLLTVHDPEQETSELDTVILKALVKGGAMKKPGHSEFHTPHFEILMF